MNPLHPVPCCSSHAKFIFTLRVFCSFWCISLIFAFLLFETSVLMCALQMIMSLVVFVPCNVIVNVNVKVHIVVTVKTWLWRRLDEQKLVFGGLMGDVSESRITQVYGSKRMQSSVAVDRTERSVGLLRTCVQTSSLVKEHNLQTPWDDHSNFIDTLSFTSNRLKIDIEFTWTGLICKCQVH